MPSSLNEGSQQGNDMWQCILVHDVEHVLSQLVKSLGWKLNPGIRLFQTRIWIVDDLQWPIVFNFGD